MRQILFKNQYIRYAPVRRTASLNKQFNCWLSSAPTQSDGVETLPNLPTASVQKAAEKDRQLRMQHLSYRDDHIEPEVVHRKKLIYRSKQRGWLEVDLLLGSWAEEHVPKMTLEELKDYEKVLNLETIEIFSVISKPENDIPEELKSPVLKRLREYAANSPFKLKQE